MSATRQTAGLLHALRMFMQPPRFEAREPAHPRVRYTEEPRRGVPPLCDVYLPDAAGPFPSVLVVHGGGFVVGHRGMKPVRLLATRLAEAGFAVCAIDYRLRFRGGGLPAQVADVDAAAAYWRSECGRFGCDPERISLLGLSAGATLALLHAGRSSHSYHRLVSIYGVTDFERMPGRTVALLVRLAVGSSDPRVRRRWSPTSQAHVPTPLLVIHGTHDQLVPVEHATHLHARREEAGLPTEMVLVEGMRHGWLNDASLRESEAAVAQVLTFLRADPA